MVSKSVKNRENYQQIATFTVSSAVWKNTNKKAFSDYNCVL